jgi:hypothetical protein
MEKKILSENEKILQDDILRYKKNKLASGLALLGLVFNCLYFMFLYGLNNIYFYNIEIGISIIITLVVLLTVFLSSEGIKNYNKTYSIVLMVVAVIQIIRLFIMPVMALNGKSLFIEGDYPTALEGHYFEAELNASASATVLIIYLALSAGCLIASSVIGYLKAVRLEKLNKKIESGEISIESTLKAVEKEEEAKAQVAANKEV